MTKAEAKEISLEVWGYLAEHPECKRKSDMPPAIYDKVRFLVNHCPLCEFFYRDKCSGCVLYESGEACEKLGSAFVAWINADDGEAGNEARATAAKRIVSVIEAWETEEAA